MESRTGATDETGGADTAPATRRTRPLRGLLKDRNASLYLGGVVVSGFGSSAMWLACPIWVKDLTGSNGLAALCTFALWAPTLVGPLLGTLADRTRRRPLLVWTNLGLAVLLMSLFAVDSVGRLWILFAVLVVYGAVGVVDDAAESVLVAAAVDKDLLGDFNGLRMSATEGMKLVAPLAGAGLLAAYGGSRVALLDAVTFALAAGLYTLLRVREEPPARDTSGWRAQTAAGARYLWGHPALRPLVVSGGVSMLLSGLNGATVYAVVDGLGHAPPYVGVLYVAQGCGSLAVGAASGTLLRLLGERRFAAFGMLLTALGGTLQVLPYDAVVLGCGAAIGVGLPCVLIAAFTAVQREVPGAVLGRVSATANSLMFAPTALGLVVGAGLIEWFDYRLLLLTLATVRALASLPLLRARSPLAGKRRPRVSRGGRGGRRGPR